jgi:hypothetical protein
MRLDLHHSISWAENNLHAYHVTNHQLEFSKNMWVAIIRDDLFGIFRIQDRLTVASYLHFLQDEIPQQM